MSPSVASISHRSLSSPPKQLTPLQRRLLELSSSTPVSQTAGAADAGAVNNFRDGDAVSGRSAASLPTSGDVVPSRNAVASTRDDASFSSIALSTAAPTTPTVCVASLKFGNKYYVGGEIENSGLRIQFIIDSGADVSIVPPNLTSNMSKDMLQTPLRVRDFSGAPNSVVDSSVRLEVNFWPGKLIGDFYVCESIAPIIGCDLLENHTPTLSLETGTGIFKVGSSVLRLKPTAKAANKEFKKRKQLGAAEYLIEFTRYISSLAWMRLLRRTALRPNATTNVVAYIDSSRETSVDHSFISFYDLTESEDILVSSANFDGVQKKYVFPVTNRLTEKMILPANFVLGEVINHPSDNTFSTGVQITPVTPFKPHPDDSPNISSTASAAAASSGGVDPSTISTPIPLSSLVDRGRLPPETVQASRERGVEIDLHLPHRPPEILMEKVKKIDVEEEINKQRKEEYWPDKNYFFSQFPCLEKLTAEHREKAKEILYAFRHVFFNENMPHQFRQGLNICQVMIGQAASN